MLESMLFFSFAFRGRLQDIWNPIFEQLKSHVDKCGIGYIDILIDLITEVDVAYETKNSETLRLLYKVYADLMDALLSSTRDKHVQAVLIKTIDICRQQQEEIVSGCIDFTSINRIVVSLSKDFKNTLNGNDCGCDGN